MENQRIPTPSLPDTIEGFEQKRALQDEAEMAETAKRCDDNLEDFLDTFDRAFGLATVGHIGQK